MKSKEESLFDSAIRKKIIVQEEDVPPAMWQNIAKMTGKKSLFEWLGPLRELLYIDVFLLLTVTIVVSLHNSGPVTNGMNSAKFEHKVNTSDQIDHSAGASDVAAGYEEEKNNSLYIEQSTDKKSDYHVSVNDNTARPTDIKRGAVQEGTTDVNTSGSTSYKSKSPLKSTDANTAARKNKSRKAQLKDRHATARHGRDRKGLMDAATGADNNNYLAMSSNERFNVYPAELLPVGIFPQNNSADFIRPLNTNKKTKRKFVSYPSLRISAGTNMLLSSPESDAENLKVNDHSRKYGNGSIFQVLFEYPLSEKWNLAGGFAQIQKKYNWTFTTTTERQEFRIHTINGFIVFPFDPPQPITITDTSEVTVIDVHAADEKISTQSIGFYLMAERSFHTKVIEVRLDAGGGIYISDKIKTETEKQNEVHAEYYNLEPGLRSPQVSALLGVEINRSKGILQPFVRIQSEQFIHNRFKGESVFNSREGSVSMMAGVRLKFVK